MGRAHPRSRGENRDTGIVTVMNKGSSPLTRGKRIRAACPPTATGLIPAHAGKTVQLAAALITIGAHPRSRGENPACGRSTDARRGSSPLTRGKRIQGRRRPNEGRLIPAHAGKTLTLGKVTTKKRAHPRSRGENIVDKPNILAGLGSSPLTRGKLQGIAHPRQPCRLIPAHAGKTLIGGGDERVHGAHPRSRGENATIVRHPASRGGSSPLTRGKRESVGGRSVRDGLIPAHAGKTSIARITSSGSWAHPRSRGENLVEPYWIGTMRGSSPLTRGKRRRGGQPIGGPRLIPAHAGKTRST